MSHVISEVAEAEIVETKVVETKATDDIPAELLGPNCILAVCCPPGSMNQERALYLSYLRSGHIRSSDSVARDYTRWILANFDLAPKGSLQPFKDTIARLAREGYTKGT